MFFQPSVFISKNAQSPQAVTRMNIHELTAFKLMCLFCAQYYNKLAPSRTSQSQCHSVRYKMTFELMIMRLFYTAKLMYGL